MTEVNSMDELLLIYLRQLLSAEHQLTSALLFTREASSAGELKAALRDHLEQTYLHIGRLETALEILQQPIVAEHCPSMAALVTAMTEVIESEAPVSLRDAALIGDARRVEHYEIASYGSALAFARLLGREDVAALLSETLDEERIMDRRLTRIAAAINPDARYQSRLPVEHAAMEPRPTLVRTWPPAR